MLDARLPAHIRLRLGFVPVVAHADVDGERRIERIGTAHLLAQDVFDRRDLDVRGLEGSKKIESWAGDIAVDVGRPEQYKTIEASVRAGYLRAHGVSDDTLERARARLLD